MKELLLIFILGPILGFVSMKLLCLGSKDLGSCMAIGMITVPFFTILTAVFILASSISKKKIVK